MANKRRKKAATKMIRWRKQDEANTRAIIDYINKMSDRKDNGWHVHRAYSLP